MWRGFAFLYREACRWLYTDQPYEMSGTIIWLTLGIRYPLFEKGKDGLMGWGPTMTPFWWT